jgi:flavorubredoxin
MKELTNVTTATATETYAPQPLPFHHQPVRVTDDTFLIRSLYGEGQAPISIYVNSLVIAGREPVIVDTGAAGNREHWLNDVFGIVDPKDVKWVFISHDDHDHVGNLAQVLDLCPNATLVTSWFQAERLSVAYNLPLYRMRWVNDGEAFDAGDRMLYAIRPPVYDSPTTRGLYDSRSKVYWASDCFATPLLQANEDVNELDAEFWQQGFYMANSMGAPWVHQADPARFNKAVDRIAELNLSAIAGAHTPIISGPRINEAFELLRKLPGMPEALQPTQADLEAMIAAMTAPAAVA